MAKNVPNLTLVLSLKRIGLAKVVDMKNKATKYIVKYMMICAIAVKIIGDCQSSVG